MKSVYRASAFLLAFIFLPAAGYSQSTSPQTKSEPTAQPLPPVVVSAPAKKAVAKKKAKTATSPAPKPAPVVQSAPTVAEPGTRNASGGTLAPVRGYVAKESAAGTKTDTPIVETPKTINVVTKDQIQAQQAQTINQALRYTPGVNVDKYGASGIFEPITVRGFEAPKYLDGLAVAKESRLTFAQPFLDPYAFERIEVIKGPSSGLYGQSPPGGLVSFTSKRPSFEKHNEVQLQTGSYDRLQAAFDFTGPVGNSDEFAYRVVGLARDADLQIDFVNAERYYINPSLTWQPNSDTRLTVLGSAGRSEGYGPQQYVPFQLTRSGNRIPRSNFLGDLDDGYTQEQYSIGYDFEHRFNEFFSVRQNLRYSTVDHELLAVREDGLISANPPLVARSLNYVEGDTKDLVVDTQAIAKFRTGVLSHRVLAGVDYGYSDGFTQFRGSFAGVVPPINPFTPVNNLPLPSINALPLFLAADTRRDLFGVYLQDQINLDRWRLTLGGRYDDAVTKSLEGRNFFGGPSTITIKDDARTGFVGLSYVFDNGFVPYANYSTSFEPASGFSLRDGVTQQPLKPTTGEGYELGAKYQPVGLNVLISGAWFDITQQNVAKPTAPPSSVTIQAGEVEIRGYEFEVRGSLNDNIDLVAGYGDLSATLSKDSNLAVVGNRFPGVSEKTASLWAMYTWRDNLFAGLGLGAGVRYVGNSFAEDANVTDIPSFTLVDAAVSYDFKYAAPYLDGLLLQLNVTNVFDKYYVTSCLTGPAFCSLGNERAFLATATYRW